MQYLNILSYRSTNPPFYSHFSASPRVKIQVLIIRHLQAYFKKVTKSGITAQNSIIHNPAIRTPN